MSKFIDVQGFFGGFGSSEELPAYEEADRRHIYLSPEGVPHIIVLAETKDGGSKWWRLVKISDIDGSFVVVGKKVLPDLSGVTLDRFIKDTTGWKVLLPND